LKPESIVKRAILLAILAVLAALFSTGVALNTYAGFNLQFSRLVQLFTGNDVLRTVLYWLSFANGDWRAAILVVLAGLLVWRQWGWFDAAFLAGAGIVSEINEGLKVAFGTPRPTPDLVQILAIEHSGAYPSGHSFFSVMFYGFIAYLALRHLKGWGRWAVLAACTLIILAVGISRIYLGVHWISDVIGGYLFGGFFLAAWIWFHDAMANKHKKAAGR
jgi:membrane-associated phospholipid phosphatase